jgi:hypothetical protein
VVPDVEDALPDPDELVALAVDAPLELDALVPELDDPLLELLELDALADEELELLELDEALELELEVPVPELDDALLPLVLDAADVVDAPLLELDPLEALALAPLLPVVVVVVITQLPAPSQIPPPSAQEMPPSATGLLQPLAGSHTPGAWQSSSGSQLTVPVGLPHAPPLQVSPTVHGLPSLHGVVSGFWENSHAPVARLHFTVWHAPAAGQSESA